jgi:hypothetical protein
MSQEAQTTHYALLDNVKNKLRLQDADESLNEELEFYLSDVDDYCNRRLRQLLGSFDHQGNPIELPLTEDTDPAVDSDLVGRAVDLAVGLFRKQQNNEEKLWDNAVIDFENYLTERFGWARDRALRFSTPPTIVVTGSIGHRRVNQTDIDYSNYLSEGETVQVKAKNFKNFHKLKVTFNGIDSDAPDPLITNPDQVVVGIFTDKRGRNDNFTLVVPTGTAGKDENIVRVEDGTESTDNFVEQRVFVIPKIGDLFGVDGNIGPLHTRSFGADARLI